jgi:hypothetical protein
VLVAQHVGPSNDVLSIFNPQNPVIMTQPLSLAAHRDIGDVLHRIASEATYLRETIVTNFGKSNRMSRSLGTVVKELSTACSELDAVCKRDYATYDKHIYRPATLYPNETPNSIHAIVEMLEVWDTHIHNRLCRLSRAMSVDSRPFTALERVRELLSLTQGDLLLV